MRLKPFNPDKELKKANHKYTKKQLITTLLVLVVMITIGTSYAIFSIQPEYHTFIKSQVGEFSTGDIKLSVLVEGESQSDFPAKGTGYAFEKVECENGSTGTWDADAWQLTLAAKGPDKCTVSFVKGILFAEYIKNLYDENNEGSNGLYYHDGQGTYTNADKEAGDNSYRFSGVNPNNFVCFGSNDEICPNDNLYRIIGVFDNNSKCQVKLIKYDYANSNLLGEGYENYYKSDYSSYKGNLEIIDRYFWNNGATCNNEWSTSELNLLNLNQNYLNNIGNKWSNLIDTTTWIIGKNTMNDLVNVPVKQTYLSEIIDSAQGENYNSKIGLMYLSDYGYAASPQNWGTNLAEYGNDVIKNDIWLFMGLREWTITINSSSDIQALAISENGSFESYSVCWNDFLPGLIMSQSWRAIRPTFYLNSNVQYISGIGSVDDPYKIS